MNKAKLSTLLLALALCLSSVVAVHAVPPQPTTLYGKVQEGGADVPDGTSVSAWMGSTESIATGSPISFPGTGVSITFSDGCTGEVSVLRRAGETQIVSRDGYTSVYALDVLGPSDWDPPADPATEGMSITLKISDTVATTETWTMASIVPLALTVGSLAGDLPYTPGNVTLLGQVWDIESSCSAFTATLTFTYDDSLLGGVDEADVAGMARYDPGYNRWQYLAGAVDTASNTVTVSEITAFSRWRILASTPPRAVADLSVSKSGSDVVLDWSAVTQDIRGEAITGVTYHIYRAANDPYFTPGAVPYDTTDGTSYTDSGAVGDPNTNYYYVVTVGATGGESALSERVGEFDLALVPGEDSSDYKYNLVALSLEVAGVTDADSLASYVGGVYMVIRYDATTQGTTYWLPDYSSGTNFPIEVGQPYFLYLGNTAPTVATLVGNVPSRRSIAFSLVPGSGASDYKYNDISIPFDRSDLTDADQLADDIGGVYMVIRYDAQTQGITYWLPDYGAGTNFPVYVGYPYLVYLKDTAPSNWPNYP